MECIKIFIWEEVLINGNERNGWQFFLRIGTGPPPPAIRLYRVHLWRTVYRHLIFSRLGLSRIYCAFQEKIEASWRKYLIWVTTKVEHKYTMVIRMFILKVINNERKILTHNEIINLIAEQIVFGDHSSV